MSVTLSPVGGAGAQFFDNNGNPLSGGKLYTYAAGTTTPVSTYTSAAGSTLHTNPIVLDSAGRVPGSSEIWLTDGVIYKFLLKTSVDVTLATWDNITGVNSNFVNFTAESEYQTATAGQTVFTLTTMTYSPGTGNLTVYVDGVNQYLGTSYVETDGVTVTFTAGLHVGALVKFTTAVETTGNATDASVVSYTPAGTGAVATTVQAKLRESVSVKDFGAVGDGVTDDTAAIQAAFDSGAKSIFVPAGSYITDALTIPADVMFVGEGANASKLIFTSGNVITNDCINMGANCQLRDLYMGPQTKDATYSVLPLLVPTAVFDYSTTIDAPRLAENCSAIGCVFDGFNTGIAADSPNVKVDKCVSKGGYAGLNFYAVDGFSITNSQFYGGTYGCVGLPSCKNGRVVGNYLVAPGSTGVNPGGSNAPGFNVENITIADNVVIGTNGVTCELGIDSVTITGNVLLIANDNPINGVGVGVATRAGGAQLRNITITGNTVRPLDPAQAYSSGISVGNDDPAGPNVPVDGVTITGNIVQGSTQGIVVQALVSLVVGATITGNRVVGGRFGLYLIALKRFSASHNLLDADSPVTISNYYGVIFADCVDGIISNNVIKGYGQHFRQVGNNVSNVSIVDNKDIPNDDSGAYVQFFNAGTSTDSLFKETESMPAAFGLFDGSGALGAVSPVVQKGVSSINKTGTGTYLVSLLRNVGANLPAVFVTVGDSSGAIGAGASVTSTTTYSFVINTYDASGVLTDYDRVSFTCIGY